MIWNSVALMTAIDIGICAVVAVALREIYVFRSAFGGAGTRRGVFIAAAGLLSLAAFYFLDLFAMWALPYFTSPDVAMAVMRSLHLDGSFIVGAVSVFLIVAGFKSINRATRQLMGKLQSARSTLEAELEFHKSDIESLDEARKKFDVIFHKSGIGVYTADRDGRIEAVNDTMCDIFGCTEDKLLGRTQIELTHLDDVAATIQRIRGVAKGVERPRNVKIRFLREDGGIIQAISNTFRVYAKDGSLISLLGTIQDITDRDTQVNERTAGAARHGVAVEP